MIKHSLGIIGGKGKMGQWLHMLLKDSFEEILIYDLDNTGSLQAFIEKCSILALSVPISKTLPLLEAMRPFLKEEQLVFDLTSLKEAPCQIMSTFKCATFGLHPLFGPSQKDSPFKTLIFCPVKPSSWDKKIQTLWIQKGYQVLEMDPKNHDQKMAWIQAMNSTVHLSMGSLLSERQNKGFLNLSTPSFSLFLRALNRFMAHDPKLYFEMAAYNPYFKEAIGVYQEKLSDYAKAIEHQDESFFIENFRLIQTFLGDFEK